MQQLANVVSWPQMNRPVLVMVLDGWVDAGLAAGNALSALREGLTFQLLATFDTDELIDYRARRPVLHIVNGVHTDVRWPQLSLELAVSPSGRSVVLLSGPEPDMQWRRFASEVVGLAKSMGVEMALGMGAFPAPVPHTRPVRLAATSSDAELANRVGVVTASLDVPSGTQGLLEHSFGEGGIPAIGLWARVPHYAAGMMYPEASAALLDELSKLAELEIVTAPLHDAASSAREQIDRMIASSPQHAAMVRQLEVQHDQEQAPQAMDIGDIPTGDEIAAELERFLRGET